MSKCWWVSCTTIWLAMSLHGAAAGDAIKQSKTSAARASEEISRAKIPVQERTTETVISESAQISAAAAAAAQDTDPETLMLAVGGALSSEQLNDWLLTRSYLPVSRDDVVLQPGTFRIVNTRFEIYPWGAAFDELLVDITAGHVAALWLAEPQTSTPKSSLTQASLTPAPTDLEVDSLAMRPEPNAATRSMGQAHDNPYDAYASGVPEGGAVDGTAPGYAPQYLAAPYTATYDASGGGRRQSARQLFAASLTAVLTSQGTGVITAILDKLAGTIVGWFTRERAPKQPTRKERAAAAAAPSAALPTHAGFAFEVHALDAAGYGKAVDPATHVFRTGDRFRVYYRPSLPGTVDVWNINQRGEHSHIDTVSVAAGELATLGPYEFADEPGRETLLLRLSPCGTENLIAATRSIVKVQAPTDGTALKLSQCGAPATRGLKTLTRSIRKVAMEGNTGFALDELQQRELSSGEVAPREVALTLSHQ